MIKWRYSTAYSLITSSKAASKQEKLNDAVESFLITYKVKDHEKNAIRLRLTRMIASRPKNNYNDASSNWENEIFYEKSMVGCPFSGLSDEPCSTNTFVNSSYQYREFFAEENNITCEKALERIVEKCTRKWQIKESKKSVVIEGAVSVMFNIGLSISQYQLLRTLCLPYFCLPTRNSIDTYKKGLYPPIEAQQLKASVNMGLLQQETFKACCPESLGGR